MSKDEPAGKKTGLVDRELLQEPRETKKGFATFEKRGR